MNAITKELLKALKMATLQNQLDMLMTGEELRKCESAIFKAEAALAAPQPSADEPVTDSYVQTVPDKCDRIVWRGRYIHLSVGQETTPQPADDGWIPWEGGDCPVPNGTVVDVKYRDESVGLGLPANEYVEDDASPAYWRADGMSNDIIAYRVVKP